MNEKKQSEGGRRYGYMGHLTRIANCIVHSTDKGPNSTLVQQLIKELPDEVRERWETFCTSSLGETNKRNTVDLVTTCHIHSSSDDEIDFKETGFSQDSSLQQAFSDYQMQQMTSNFIDQFGFNDEKFADQDDIGKTELVCSKSEDSAEKTPGETFHAAVGSKRSTRTDSLFEPRLVAYKAGQWHWEIPDSCSPTTDPHRTLRLQAGGSSYLQGPLEGGACKGAWGRAAIRHSLQAWSNRCGKEDVAGKTTPQTRGKHRMVIGGDGQPLGGQKQGAHLHPHHKESPWEPAAGRGDRDFSPESSIHALDRGSVSFDRVSDINFTLNTNESGNIALFEACCKERIQQFDDGGSDEEDIWEEKHIAFTPESQRRSR
ncbi:UNVERIFIED_CONTAM: hypothetical protein K2H54_064117 [Gekko kuhli]